jgi:hypothetical protein
MTPGADHEQAKADAEFQLCSLLPTGEVDSENEEEDKEADAEEKSPRWAVIVIKPDADTPGGKMKMEIGLKWFRGKSISTTGGDPVGVIWERRSIVLASARV